MPSPGLPPLRGRRAEGRAEIVFLEVIIPVPPGGEVGDRHEIEEALTEALEAAWLGEVTGGGTGFGQWNIDVDLGDDVDLEVALSVMRGVLREFALPVGARIVRHQPTEAIYDIFD